MKVSARLVKALIGLCVSVVLCVGVCLAWFTVNNKVDSDVIDTTVHDLNISSFKVTAYSLTKSGEGTTEGAEGIPYIDYAIGAADVSGSVVMKPYGNLDGDVTALLLKFTYSFNDDLGKNYGIFVKYAKTLLSVADQMVSRTQNDAQYEFKCDLSLAIGFFEVQADIAGGTVRRLSQLTSPEGLTDRVNLNGGAAQDKAGEAREFYCIIDYVDSNVEALYAYALDNLNGSLTSQMRFENDMSFYMVEV